MKSSDSADPGLGRRAGCAFDLLCGEEDAFGVAVSGGSDSLALLMLAADWGRRQGKRIAAATVDHGLRPEAADEARHVARICEEMGIPHATLHWRKTSAGPAAQAEARRARHRLLARWAAGSGLRLIVLGHTRDDRIETFLMRARQGSGWYGLAGLLPLGASPVWPEGRGICLARPLLALGRDELRRELRARDRDWIEDPSNEAAEYERVRMRRLVSLMDAGAAEQALRVMDGLARMRAAVLAEARAGLAGAAFSGAEVRIPTALLAGLGPEARRRLVEALLAAAGGALAFPRREALDRLLARLAGWREAGLTLAGAVVRVRDGVVAISRAPPRRGQARPGPGGPDWDRARALLADPRLEALDV